MDVPLPTSRRLRVYTYDPDLSTRLETRLINETVLRVPWEPLAAGPIGEYLEVIDHDPASDSYYEPIDLDSPALLAQDGLAPSEGNPQFHQQMVYAVAMRTIDNFEKALGRRALWAPRRWKDSDDRYFVEQVPRLRIYPHALREANAFYSPEKKALLFGYFPSHTADPGRGMPGSLVFTCLSHDIVAHETTHALLEGLHPHFTDPTNPDVLAFHEAFADIVALFQHFSIADALRDAIAQTRGDLARRNPLAELASQFGEAIGHRGALRSAIGSNDPVTGRWSPHVPDPSEYLGTTEPHARGAILVAAVFDAFLGIYRARTVDLLRIATGGTGSLPRGRIHPDLVDRLANEAAKVAGHVLRICIRALDYCPPVDITFGEYLRALITADSDLVPDDPIGYRVAFIDAFRRRGIYPRDLRTLGPDMLLWRKPAGACRDFDDHLNFARIVRMARSALFEHEQRAEISRADRAKLSNQLQAATHEDIARQLLRLDDEARAAVGHALGLELDPQTTCGSVRRGKDGLPSFQVFSFRRSLRPTMNGDVLEGYVIELIQTRAGFFGQADQDEADQRPHGRADSEGDFEVRGGCTLLVDGCSGSVRYAIRKPTASRARLDSQRDFLRKQTGLLGLRATYSPLASNHDRSEPFAALHRGL